ncbi:AAA family ATPase [Deinococcus geothermalis]|uniref:AAA family ATPase n=1 Tax=Deinococcus geothermalis TaxID=68909 RepID=UPI00031B4987|nr:AAA family ATPase [Deinococcus geothermalis]
MEANDHVVTNVQIGVFTPQPGEVYEAVPIGRGRVWRLSQRKAVQLLPDKLIHPKYPALFALARDLPAPEVLRIGESLAVVEETDPVSLVTLWHLVPEAEAAYVAGVLSGQDPYPDVNIRLSAVASQRLRPLSNRASEMLISAAQQYEAARQNWSEAVHEAQEQWRQLIDEATAELRLAEEHKEEVAAEVLRLQQAFEELTGEIREARQCKSELEDKLASLEEQLRSARERIQALEVTQQNPRAALRQRQRVLDEVEVLKYAWQQLASRLPDPIPLVQLHVALKHAPFTVLAGPSGAGKTSLVHQYAQALGICVTTVAVQPNWTSVQDLHGYVDPLGGERYRGTPFSAALQAQVDYAATDDLDAPLDLVLLDEINLAHVEYFLSDYLSAFETAGREVQLATRAEVEGLPDEACAWLKRGKGQVQVPRSFLIAGTANEDHTTRAFSDKFRDRSAFLHLPPPDIAKALAAPESNLESEVYVSRAAWESWQRGWQPSDAQRARVRALAERVAQIELPFSVRVFRRALWQYADVQRLLGAFGVSNAGAQAFDLAVSLSVVPKYAPFLLGRDQEAQRQALRKVLSAETGRLTQQVLEGIWSTTRA